MAALKLSMSCWTAAWPTYLRGSVNTVRSRGRLVTLSRGISGGIHMVRYMELYCAMNPGNSSFRIG